MAAEPGWRAVEHPRLGFRLLLPDRFQVRLDTAAAALVAAEHEAPPGHLAASVVVTAEPLDDLPDWVGRSRDNVLTALLRGRLIDEGPGRQADGAPSSRLLLHYFDGTYGGVALEQRLCESPRGRFVVSCTGAVLGYDDLADVFERIGSSLVGVDETASRQP